MPILPSDSLHLSAPNVSCTNWYGFDGKMVSHQLEDIFPSDATAESNDFTAWVNRMKILSTQHISADWYIAGCHFKL